MDLLRVMRAPSAISASPLVATGGDSQWFHALPYTLDLFLPVANLGQRDAFTPHGYATWCGLGLTLVGWLLGAIVVAGLAGVFSRA